MTLLSFPDPNSIEARQALLDRRCERAHPKRHRTAKRKSRAAAAKRSAGKHKAAANLAAKRTRDALVAAFYRGDRAEWPP